MAVAGLAAAAALVLVVVVVDAVFAVAEIVGAAVGDADL